MEDMVLEGFRTLLEEMAANLRSPGPIVARDPADSPVVHLWTNVVFGDGQTVHVKVEVPATIAERLGIIDSD